MAESIRIVRYGSDGYNDVREIRNRVFVEEQGIDPEAEHDELDRVADFAILYYDGKPCATARLIVKDSRFKIGRIAVLKECRGLHLGAAVVNAVCDRARELGADRIYLNSQKHAVAFYEKLGFSVNGGELIDRGIVHLPMVKEV